MLLLSTPPLMELNQTMSLTDPQNTCKNISLHRRNDSGELHVFEAAQYFSGDHGNQTPFSPEPIRNDGLHAPPMIRNNNPDSKIPAADQKQGKENRKQPSSPGGRIAAFLNAIFNQAAAKKKKKKKNPKSGKDNHPDRDESPVFPRKRRSSISHFTTTSSRITNDSRSPYSSSSSGFRTPPPCSGTTTANSLYEFAGFVSKSGNDESAEKWIRSCLARSDFESFGISGRNSVNNSSGNFVWAADEERDQFRNFGDGDDGADSDSSSDLFDLPNHDLGLPVYGTTHMDRIRINAAPVSRAATA